jgi:hypothetical protein
MQNCGPKTGRVSVTAATCRVQNATLLDDDPDPAPSPACVVDGEASDLGTCSQRR